MENNFISLKPYIAGEQVDDSSYIKLNTNENPYPPSPLVDEVLGGFDSASLRKYPNPDSNLLLGALSEYYKLPKDMIFVGNGSDEVLALSYRSFFNSGKPVIFSQLSYSFYPVWADFYKIPYKYSDDYSIENGGVVIANPNAPTGEVLSRDDIEKILISNKESVVLIDEAYIDFGGDSSLSLVNDHENLLVIQTFSKGRSLAGLRVGMAFGSKTLIERLYMSKNAFNSYPVDRISCAAARASLRDEKYFNETISRICRTRKRVKDELESMGVKVGADNANFLFIKIPKAKEIKDYLFENKIMVRYFDNLKEYLRVSIGTENEMDEFLHIFKEAIGAI